MKEREPGEAGARRDWVRKRSHACAYSLLPPPTCLPAPPARLLHLFPHVPPPPDGLFVNYGWKGETPAQVASAAGARRSEVFMG